MKNRHKPLWIKGRAGSAADQEQEEQADFLEKIIENAFAEGPRHCHTPELWERIRKGEFIEDESDDLALLPENGTLAESTLCR
jgi:hypothetical protein